MLLDTFTELSYYRLGYTMKTFVNAAFTIVPIIIIIKCIMDLFKLVLNPDESKNTPKTIARRFISGLIVFLLPVITNYTFKEMTNYDDSKFIKYYEGSSLEKIKQLEQQAERERKEALDKRIQENIEAAKKQAQKRKEIMAQGKKLKKDRPSSGGSQGPSVGIQSDYVITDDPKFNNYKTISSCNGSKLKYKVIEANGEYYTLIWAADPTNQMNLGLAANNTYGRTTGNVILNNEVNSNNYQNSCLVGVNASFFSYSTNSPVSGVVISKGQVVKDTGSSGAVMGLNKDGELKVYVNVSSGDLLNDGVRNTVAVSNGLSVGMGTDGPKAGRTQLGQIDVNNYVLFTGSGTVGGCFSRIHNMTGAKTGANLDGGGSRKLYYKTNNQSTVTSVMEGGRPVPDMLYFAGE